MRPVLTICLALATVAAQAQSWKAGDKAPAFSGSSLEGKRISLRDLQDEGPFFLFFIKPDDATSRQAETYISKIARAYAPNKVKWYGVLNSRPQNARSWMAEYNPPYKPILDDGSMIQQFHVRSSPTVIQIGTNGKIIRQWVGYSGYWLKDLNKSVAKASGKKSKPIDFSKTPSVTRMGGDYVVHSH